MKSNAPPPELPGIAVFAKAPVAGEVKTRLAATLGDEGAARLHERLVERALATALEARLGPVTLWCSPDESHPFFQGCARRDAVPLRRQVGADLGERMHHAFEATPGPLLLIGSDCPALAPRDLHAAAEALRTRDAVFIPAEDGGYVLVGLARAALPSTHRAHHAARLSWLALGVSGHGADTGLDDLVLPGAPLLDVPTGGSTGAQAVRLAMQYLGVPYVWGGASPGGFDCSGLVMFVYSQVGVSLPHHAADQYNYGVPVSRDQLEPGDLVFFDGLGHVGIYIGNGQFIHAPHTGDVVKISSLNESWYAATYVGARRIT